MSNASKSLANDLVLASVKLTRHLRVADQQARMSGPQASALAVIVYAGRIRVSDLAAMEQVRSPTMVQMVNQLEAQGLAVREGDETDRRVSWVRATAKGQRYLQQGQERRIGPLASYVDGLGRDDRAVLARAVALINGMLDQQNSAKKGPSD
jgi:DNA-binding MarR family transcriptional regulator